MPITQQDALKKMDRLYDGTDPRATHVLDEIGQWALTGIEALGNHDFVLAQYSFGVIGMMCGNAK